MRHGIHGITGAVVIAAVLALSAGMSTAAESAHTAKQAQPHKANAKAAKQAKTEAAPKLVDINSAGAAELKALPGIGDAEARKIIAGRPYHTKAELLTHEVLGRGAYEGLKARIVALQR